MTGRRRLEIAVLAFGAVFLSVVAYSFRPGRRPSSRPANSGPGAPESQDGGQAMTVSKGFDYTETVGGKPVFRIQSERTVGFGPGAGLVPNAYVLEQVSLTLYPEGGAPVTVHSDKAQYDRRTNESVLTGNVRWSDEKGALGETSRVEFHPSAHQLIAPAAIHFARGTFNVQAPSGRYDLNKRELTLAGPVAGSGTGEGSGGLSRIAADGAVYRRDEGVIELIGNVSGDSHSGDRVACDRMTLKTEQEGHRFEWARAEGNVHGVLVSAGTAGPAAPARERRYAGDRAALLFAPDGAVQSLSLTGAPARVEETDRKVDAQTIDVAFDKGRATSARAQGNVRMESPQSNAECASASLAFEGSGEIGSLELSGDVRMQGEGRSARADKAVEIPSRGIWILTGGEGGSATAESEGSRVSAARIEMDRTRRTLDADGNARAVFVPEDPKSKGKTKAKVPALVGDSSRPTFGKAARMVFDDTSRVATLSGGATLWQGASSLFGDDVTLNDMERTLVAVGHTRTVVAPESGPAVQGPDRGPSVITARRVIYREAEATALFEEGVTLTRGPWHGSAQRVTALFGADRKIERVEMTGNVSLVDSAAGRTGKADKAVDWPQKDRTVLTGSPAVVTDAEGNRVSGASLTITEGGRTVEVTAPDGGKTETIHKTRKQ